MSLVSDILATALHPASSTVAVGFSLLLVLWLVVAEETELHRGRGLRSEPDHSAAVADRTLMSSSTV